MKKIKDIDLGNRKILFEYQKRFFNFIEISIKRNVFNKNTINSIGTLLENCKNCFDCFFAKNGENLRFADFNINLKDCMDMHLGVYSNNCYFSAISLGSHIYFCANTRDQSLEIEYSINCRNCSYCFGCIGLNKKQFCILNKQYSEKIIGN